MNAVAAQMLYCRHCGHQVHATAPSCPGCGAPQKSKADSDKRILPAFLLCFFFGFFGVHRFYVGKVGTGILMFLTCGGFFVVYLLDFIRIICGSFTDAQGRKIKQWA